MILFRYFAFVLCMMSARNIHGQSSSELAGRWLGTGKIVSDWCDQDTLYLDIAITTDGDISGKVGDAFITKGYYEPGNEEPDFTFKIILTLKGNLIECESVKRNKLILLVNKNDDELAGIFYTEGKLFGGKKQGILTGKSLILRYD